jgi:aminoglycoside phosphotransferase (APT) family kinase protein
VTSDVDDQLHTLETWLTERLPPAGALRLAYEGKPGSGFSAETTILSGTWSAGEARTERFVLRKETPDPPVYPTQVPGVTCEVDIQWKLMSAVSDATSKVPLAPLIGYEDDPAVLGAPFFVMGFVDGVVPIESPPYAQEGFFTELAPDRRRVLVENGVRTLAEVHAIDWKAAGLEWLTAGDEPSAERQLDIWNAYMDRELAGRTHPVWDEAIAWLRANLPPERPPVLCWGDPRLGNIIWRDEQPVCVTDWEAASIAPAEVDLGWWLMFDRWSHETPGVPRLEGEPTRDEQRTLYEHLSGREVGDTTWYEIFAAARYTAIVVRVMNRMVARGDLPADQTIWLENPATVCLQQLFEEHGL